jgi:transcription factor SFP1
VPSPLLSKRKAVSVPGATSLPPPIPKVKKVRQSSLSVLDPETGQRKYICAVIECGKQYKNANGLKYHLLHAHPDGVGVPAEYHDLFQKKKEDEGHRPYTCSIAGCEKKYKNLNGLKVCRVFFTYV